ncbi:MAG TPA: tyrosine--tRNA ligase [Frankiaceae bacterium]|nr:tyrosine--tRNA ligase [Frankiaceae bacterium]
MSDQPSPARPASVLDELEWRGLIAQATDETALAVALAQPPMTVYAGFDPTARSLHAGNLVPLLTLRRLQQAGHRPIVIAGGATGLIGDPSGRSSERSMLTQDEVRANVERISVQLRRFLDFTPGPAQALLVNNLDWIAPMSAIDFLRDVGKHFPVNGMLEKDSVRNRLEGGGLTFAEFSYQLLQAADYLELFRRYGCRLQIGGSDQWGNITAGLDYIRRATGQSAHGLTVPLVTNASGEKFGKSTGGGRVWLDPELTSPYAFFQFFLNTDDRDVSTYLRLFTDLTQEEIAELETAVREKPHERAAQRRLASDFTALLHGPEEVAKVVAASGALFGRGALEELAANTLAAAVAEIPAIEISRAQLEAGVTIVELAVSAGLCSSRSDARRQIDQGGLYVNNNKVLTEDARLSPDQLLAGSTALLRRGRRQLAAVRVV